jgi:hypothetical protein
MKLLITGLSSQATEASVKVGMEKLGVVQSVSIHSADEKGTWAIVEMPITHERAFQITQQVKDIWHDGNFVSINVLNH